MIDRVEELGILPLLSMGICGWSVQEMASAECQYHRGADGSIEWPLWKWKGDVIRECGCAYGRFLDRKACFISKEWWPDFCNYRRSRFPQPPSDSVEGMILAALKEHVHLDTRALRAACGFEGAKQRGRFATYIARLEMGCYVVAEDFVYQKDRHGKEFGIGSTVLTAPETLLGRDACCLERSATDSKDRLIGQLRSILPDSSDDLFDFLLK